MVEHSSTSSEKTKDNVETYDPESYEVVGAKDDVNISKFNYSKDQVLECQYKFGFYEEKLARDVEVQQDSHTDQMERDTVTSSEYTIQPSSKLRFGFKSKRKKKRKEKTDTIHELDEEDFKTSELSSDSDDSSVATTKKEQKENSSDVDATEDNQYTLNFTGIKFTVDTNDFNKTVNEKSSSLKRSLSLEQEDENKRSKPRSFEAGIKLRIRPKNEAEKEEEKQERLREVAVKDQREEEIKRKSEAVAAPESDAHSSGSEKKQKDTGPSCFRSFCLYCRILTGFGVATASPTSDYYQDPLKTVTLSEKHSDDDRSSSTTPPSTPQNAHHTEKNQTQNGSPSPPSVRRSGKQTRDRKRNLISFGFKSKKKGNTTNREETLKSLIDITEVDEVKRSDEIRTVVSNNSTSDIDTISKGVEGMDDKDSDGVNDIAASGMRALEEAAEATKKGLEATSGIIKRGVNRTSESAVDQFDNAADAAKEGADTVGGKTKSGLASVGNVAVSGMKIVYSGIDRVTGNFEDTQSLKAMSDVPVPVPEPKTTSSSSKSSSYFNISKSSSEAEVGISYEAVPPPESIPDERPKPAKKKTSFFGRKKKNSAASNQNIEAERLDTGPSKVDKLYNDGKCSTSTQKKQKPKKRRDSNITFGFKKKNAKKSDLPVLKERTPTPPKKTPPSPPKSIPLPSHSAHSSLSSLNSSSPPELPDMEAPIDHVTSSSSSGIIDELVDTTKEAFSSAKGGAEGLVDRSNELKNRVYENVNDIFQSESSSESSPEAYVPTGDAVIQGMFNSVTGNSEVEQNSEDEKKGYVFDKFEVVPKTRKEGSTYRYELGEDQNQKSDKPRNREGKRSSKKQKALKEEEPEPPTRTPSAPPSPKDAQNAETAFGIWRRKSRVS